MFKIYITSILSAAEAEQMKSDPDQHQERKNKLGNYKGSNKWRKTEWGVFSGKYYIVSCR